MKILLLTPLFPPDTGDPAAYAKELAGRLSTLDTTVLLYGRLPENVTNVSFLPIDKRQWLLSRLVKLTLCLFTESRKADLIIVNNAPSTEFPALIISFVRRRKMLLVESDPLVRASESLLYKILHNLFARHCVKTITLPPDASYKKPEILPFEEISLQKLEERELWWKAHITELLAA